MFLNHLMKDFLPYLMIKNLLNVACLKDTLNQIQEKSKLQEELLMEDIIMIISLIFQKDFRLRNDIKKLMKNKQLHITRADEK